MFCFRTNSGQEMMTTSRALRSAIAVQGGHAGGHLAVNYCSAACHKGLQNLYSAVRSRPAPPTTYTNRAHPDSVSLTVAYDRAAQPTTASNFVAVLALSFTPSASNVPVPFSNPGVSLSLTGALGCVICHTRQFHRFFPGNKSK
jgi:hypothetical protein